MASPSWSLSTKRLVAITLLVAGVYAAFRLSVILTPLVAAGVLAFVLNLLVNALAARSSLSRTLVTALVFLVLAILLILIPATILPPLVAQVNQINVNLQQVAEQVNHFLDQPVEVWGYQFDLPDVTAGVQGTLQDLLTPIATQTVNLVFGVASSLVWVIFVLVVAFYLVKDAPRLSRALERLIPPAYGPELHRLRDEVGQVWRAFFRGQVVLGLVVGVVVWITMLAVGLPHAGTMGLLAGLFEVIPTIGPVLAAIPALLVALFQGSIYLPLAHGWFALLVGGLYVLIQQVENSYIVPRVMGQRLHLHPLVVLVGVVAGGLLAGALGVFLAAPVIATFRVLLSYVGCKLLGQDPYPLPPPADELYPGEIDALLFDLDGTLIETDDQLVAALTRLLALPQRVRLVKDPPAAARRLVTALDPVVNRLLGLLDRVGLDDEFFRARQRLQGVYDGLLRLRGVTPVRCFRPVPGAPAAVREMAEQYQIAIVTTRSSAEARAFLEQTGLLGLVSVITGRDVTWRLKPHPEPIKYTARQLDVPVHRCLLVGDTRLDIQAAVSAGARAAGVLSGFGRRADLEAAGADLIVPDVSTLGNWL